MNSMRTRVVIIKYCFSDVAASYTTMINRPNTMPWRWLGPHRCNFFSPCPRVSKRICTEFGVIWLHGLKIDCRSGHVVVDVQVSAVIRRAIPISGSCACTIPITPFARLSSVPRIDRSLWPPAVCNIPSSVRRDIIILSWPLVLFTASLPVGSELPQFASRTAAAPVCPPPLCKYHIITAAGRSPFRPSRSTAYACCINSDRV